MRLLPDVGPATSLRRARSGGHRIRMRSKSSFHRALYETRLSVLPRVDLADVRPVRVVLMELLAKGSAHQRSHMLEVRDSQESKGC